MSEKEKQVIESLAAVVDRIPDCKKDYFLGYADAVADLNEEKEKQPMNSK